MGPVLGFDGLGRSILLCETFLLLACCESSTPKRHLSRAILGPFSRVFLGPVSNHKETFTLTSGWAVVCVNQRLGRGLCTTKGFWQALFVWSSN
jgi:hypothetical protein